MESRYYKDDLKDIILDMAHKELGNYVSQKGAQKYFEGNIDKVINNYVKKISNEWLLYEYIVFKALKFQRLHTLWFNLYKINI